MLIIGAGGLAKEIICSWRTANADDSLVLFDNVSKMLSGPVYETYDVIRSESALKKYFERTKSRFIIGVGGTDVRRYVRKMAEDAGGIPATYIADTAMIGDIGTNIGLSTVVLDQAMVTTSVTVGDGCILNKQVIVSHDSQIGDYCQLSPGAKIMGHAKIDSFTDIGANACVLPRVKIGAHCHVGAGAVVTKDVPDNTTVVGVPARSISST